MAPMPKRTKIAPAWVNMKNLKAVLKESLYPHPPMMKYVGTSMSSQQK